MRRVTISGMSEPANVESRQFWTTEQIAKMLHLSQTAVYAWLREGRIPSHKIGKRRLVKDRDLNEFIESCKVDPAADTGAD